ncbi:MAG TPA: glycosyltransferase family 87 protein [Terracidiphilus sp.]|nr:glycosyltransferase family 87 protein [Terracidiphilus sp.]
MTVHAVGMALRPNPDAAIRNPSKIRTRTLWSIGWAAAAVSAAAGVANAVRHSQDFQWSPTRLLLHHINPWQVELAGDPHHQLILSQGPNYAHFLYLLFAPFGAISFPVARLVWAFCNLALAGVALWYCQRIFRLSRQEWGVAAILFLLGTPFRNSVGNGQQSLLVLAFIALAYGVGPRSPRWLWFGLSYCKYSSRHLISLIFSSRAASFSSWQHSFPPP